MDLTALLIDKIKNDAGVAAVVGTKVYGYTIPADVKPPLVLVSQMSAAPTTDPQTVWWDTMVQVDVHAEKPQQSHDLAQLVTDLLPTVVGSHDKGVVADSRIDSLQTVIDDGWTPIRYRQVVTVDLTAREP